MSVWVGLQRQTRSQLQVVMPKNMIMSMIWKFQPNLNFRGFSALELFCFMSASWVLPSQQTTKISQSILTSCMSSWFSAGFSQQLRYFPCHRSLHRGMYLSRLSETGPAPCTEISQNFHLLIPGRKLDLILQDWSAGKRKILQIQLSRYLGI